ncbi:MAG: hypothetical protein AAGG01_12405, partial [Planctomycetota bacterium]
NAGRLCLGSPVGRFGLPGQVQSTGLAGFIELDVDLTSLPTPSGHVAAQLGESWTFQAWFRDVPGGSEANFTDAVRVMFE